MPSTTTSPGSSSRSSGSPSNSGEPYTISNENPVPSAGTLTLTDTAPLAPRCRLSALPPELLIQILSSFTLPSEAYHFASTHTSCTCALAYTFATNRPLISRAIITSLPGAPHLLNLYRLLVSPNPPALHNPLTQTVNYNTPSIPNTLEVLHHFATVNVTRFLDFHRRHSEGALYTPTETERERIYTGVYINAYLTLLGLLTDHNATTTLRSRRRLPTFNLHQLLSDPDTSNLGPITFCISREFLWEECVRSHQLSHLSSRELMYAHNIACTMVDDQMGQHAEVELFAGLRRWPFWEVRKVGRIDRWAVWRWGERMRWPEVLAKELVNRVGETALWEETCALRQPLVPRVGEVGGEAGVERGYGSWCWGWGVWDKERREVGERLRATGWKVVWW